MRFCKNKNKETTPPKAKLCKMITNKKKKRFFKAIFVIRKKIFADLS